MKYKKKTWIELLREGVWNGFDYTGDFINQIAESYDPELLLAPITLGHVNPWVDKEEPAYGHVLQLKVEPPSDDKDSFKLMGEVGLFDETVDLIESGKYYNRSIGWDSFYPLYGIPYLCHVALLGASNPASVGMETMTLSFEPRQFVDEADVMNADKEHEMVYLSRSGNLIWDVTDNFIRYRIRHPNRFRDDTFRTTDVSKKDGISSVMGKLKPEFVPEGGNANAMVMQNVMFDKNKDWTLSKAKEWVKSHKDSLSHSIEDENDNTVDYQTREQVDSDNITVHNEKESSDIDSIEINSENINQGGEPQMDTTDVVEETVESKQQTTTPPATKTIPPEPVHIEPLSSVDLQRKNMDLQQQLDEANRQLLEQSSKLHNELKAEMKELRYSQIATRIQQLEVEGYVVPAQKKLGIVQALAAVPEGTKVKLSDDREYRVEDIVIECLKIGGKLKLKGEFDIPEQTRPVKYEDLETARSSRKVTGLDVAEKMMDYMNQGKTADEAIHLAETDIGGGK